MGRYRWGDVVLLEKQRSVASVFWMTRHIGIHTYDIYMRTYSLAEIADLNPLDLVGQLILYPTETVYGLGCSLFDAIATNKISLAKKRAPEQQYISLVDTVDRVMGLVEPLAIPEKALLESDIVVTVLLRPSSVCPSEYIHSGTQLFSVRKTTHPVCLELIRLLDSPLVSTSANIHGQPPSARFADIPDELLESVDIAINAGDIPYQLPSTIVKYHEGDFQIVRQGATTYEQIAVFL